MESLRLAGKDGPASGTSYPAMEAVQDGSLLRVRVEANLWQNKQPATYLLVKVREGIAGLADAGLAHDLATGRLAPAPGVVRRVPGFAPAQQEAYESCLGRGVRLVWGPPGTDKTRVLAEAIGTLAAAGKRVLLVPAEASGSRVRPRPRRHPARQAGAPEVPGRASGRPAHRC